MLNTAPTRFAVLFAICLGGVATSAAAQGTDEQREACAGDAFTLCRDTIPDIPKTTACMKAHVAQLSPRCHAVFLEATEAPKASPKAARGRETKVASGQESSSHRHGKPVQVRERGSSLAMPARVPRRRQAPEREQPAVSVAAVPKADALALPTPTPPTPSLPSFQLPSVASYRASIVDSCRRHLIDPYTCRSSLEVLRGLE